MSLKKKRKDRKDRKTHLHKSWERRGENTAHMPELCAQQPWDYRPPLRMGCQQQKINEARVIKLDRTREGRRGNRAGAGRHTAEETGSCAFPFQPGANRWLGKER